MNIMDVFWDSVAMKITDSFRNGHPSTWKKKDIDSFLGVFVKKIREICNGDKAKKWLLLEGKDLTNSNSASERIDISYDTFWHIFIKKDRHGGKTTREMFAIYFGSDSFKDYIAKNNLKGNLKESPLPEKKKTAKSPTEKGKKKNIDVENINAGEDISIKINQEDNSSAKINDLEAKNGSVIIDINQE